jgi:hypothetical protein
MHLFGPAEVSLGWNLVVPCQSLITHISRSSNNCCQGELRVEVVCVVGEEWEREREEGVQGRSIPLETIKSLDSCLFLLETCANFTPSPLSFPIFDC